VWPSGTVALKVTVPEPQRLLALAPVGTAGTAFTVTNALLDVAEQAPLLTTTVYVALAVKAAVV
jgi:hypothetical protein